VALALAFLESGAVSEAGAKVQSLIASEEKRKRDSPELMSAYALMAKILLKSKHYAEADVHASKALGLARKIFGDKHPKIAELLDTRGDIFTGMKRWDSALDSYADAARLTLERADYDRSALTDQVSLAARKFKTSEVARYKKRFANIVQSAYALSREGATTRPGLLGQSFEAGQWQLMSEAAVAFSQMSARKLAEGPELQLAIRTHQDLAAQWKALDDRLNKMRAANATGATSADFLALKEQHNRVEASFRELSNHLRANYPKYFALSAPRAIAVPDVQKILTPTEALVQVISTESDTFLWVVSKTQAHWKRVDVGADWVAKTVTELRCGLDRTDTAGNACKTISTSAIGPSMRSDEPPHFNVELAYELYKKIIAPVADVLKDKSIIFIPSRQLASIPPSVLVTAPPSRRAGGQSVRYSDVAWLGTTRPIWSLPSVAALEQIRLGGTTQNLNRRPYAGIGNPILEGDQSNPVDYARALSATTRQDCSRLSPQPRSLRRLAVSSKRDASSRVSDIREMTPLPETAAEICGIASRLGAAPRDVLLGSNATKREVMRRSADGTLVNYSIVHFATHGVKPNEIVGHPEAGLVLSPPPRGTVADEADDGYLSTRDIVEMKFDADWLILSACNTGAGDADDTEALSGLARAFFYAGARTLLVSHWNVVSEAVVLLTSSTIQNYNSAPKMGRAEALRRSMAAVMLQGSRSAHPSYWAPFAIYGEGGTWDQAKNR
jgi:CHAT domain-containing protein